jgi:hypothetical protein
MRDFTQLLALYKTNLLHYSPMSNRLTPLLGSLRKSLAAKIIAGLVIFYFLFAWFAVNPLAKWLLPWVADTQLASKASVEKVVFDPFQLTTTIEKLSLTEKSGAPLASFDKLIVDLEFSGLFDWAWKLKRVELTAPQVNILVSKQGRLNWSDLIAKLNEDPTPPNKDLPRVIIENIDIRKGDIEYKDEHHPSPLQASLKPLDFVLDGFSTLPKDRGDYLIAAKLPYQGGTLKWKGDFGVNPPASKGLLSIEGLQIAKLMQWVNTQSLPLQAEAGTFSSEMKYDFSLPNQQPKLLLDNVKLSIHGLAGKLAQGDHLALNQLELLIKKLVFQQHPHTAVTSQEIAIKLDQLELKKPQATLSLASANLNLPKLDFNYQNTAQVIFQNLGAQFNELHVEHQQQPLLHLPALSIAQVDFNLVERRLDVANISLANGKVSATNQANGKLDWQQIFTSENTAQTSGSTEQSAETNQPTEKAATPFHIAISEIGLSHWQLAYIDQQFAKPLQASINDFNLALAIDQQADLQISNLHAEANQVNLQSDKKVFAQLAQLAINEGKLELGQQKASLGAIQLTGLKTSVIRQADQQLNWQSILLPANKNVASSQTNQAASQQAKTSSASAKKTGWSYGLKRFSLQKADIHIEDQTTATPILLDVTDGQIEVTDLSQNMARPLPVKAGFNVKQGGQFNAQGKLSPAPFKTDLQLSLNDLSLKPFAPYIQQAAVLNLQDGSASIQGKLQQAISGSTNFNGGFSIDHLSLLEEADQQPFVRWEKLQGDGFSLALAPSKLQLSTLTLTKPQTKFIIYPDRSLNISKVLRTQPASNTSSGATPASTPATTSSPRTATADTSKNANSSDFPVTIETVRINDAQLEFADLSLPQPFGTNIHSLGGVINGVSSNSMATAQVELDGKVDEYGAARIRGSLQPFKTTDFTDIKLAFTNLEMNRLTPYSGKFAGRKIESGKLSVDLEYKIKQRKLAGENKFVINKLTLGEKVDSKDAANLPLDLAIAILEDSNGVIDLDLPISGSLDDPKFSYGSILWKAFTNVLTKIVTAPFSALGKLFGSSEKMEAITFDPGKSVISPPELEKLHAVSTALNKRQQLKLGITPGYDKAADTRAIQEMTLRKQVADEMGIRLEPGQSAGPIDLNNPKVQTAIQALHDKLTNKGLLKRLAAKLEKVPAEFYPQAQEALTVSIQVTEADLQALAKARAESMAKVLTDGGISQDRVAIMAPAMVKADRDEVPAKLTLDAIKH